VADGSSATVLLPLVDPAGVATVFSALRAEFGASVVTRRTMSIDALAALGPLSGRLTPGPTGMG
jgi:small neutral amino acid transporter SnatA (MarC family)